MQSFRSEIENPIVEKDIIDLERRIRLFKEGKIDEDRFRLLRLARGVYGQRQPGVQMIRIKLPYGRVSANQLRRIAAVSDEYSTGKLHITTRQDIQIHYVDLERTPQLWAELEKDDVTLREACGNTVRNITGSEDAGINPEEPFDISPYAHAMFQFLLRNPVCQEMGRKFKISFSSSDQDTGLSYMHDLGFIPKMQDGERGFKVMLGGGLGSQPRHADMLYEFIPANQIIPLAEGVLRVFDRHGERTRRMKARMKYLIDEIGIDTFMKLVEEERKALSHQTFEIDYQNYQAKFPSGDKGVNFDLSTLPDVSAREDYKLWKATNVLPQKQKGFVAIGVKVLLGDFSSDKARKIADLIEHYAAGEIRLSLRQNMLIRHVREELLPFFYEQLKSLGLADPGYNSLIDITACPGTDTCNLGIAGSTEVTKVLEKLIAEEYPEYLKNKSLFIKISGCMNACAQHNMSPIGFQGMSIKKGKLVAPALQVLLGGSALTNGQGKFSDKVIKIPSKRAPQALRLILNDYRDHAAGTAFTDYYERKGQMYFYDLLKPLADTETMTEDEFVDWGYKAQYVQEVGIGECASVIIDLIATLLLESEEKLDSAHLDFSQKHFANAIYYAYTSMINSAKALLISKDKKTNTHKSIISDFDSEFGNVQLSSRLIPFSELIYQINKNEPSEAFAKSYLSQATDFHKFVLALRQKLLENA